MRRKVFPGTEISLADRRDLGDRDNFYPILTQLSRLAGKLSECLHFTKSTSQRENLPGKRENISPYEQNNIIWPVEMFSRQPR